MDTERRAHDVSLDAIAALLHKAGVPAFVENSGGNVMCIYIGPTHKDETDSDRFALLVGPGYQDAPPDGQVGPPLWLNMATTDELFYGPDDDGDSEQPAFPAGATEVDIANTLAEAYRNLQQ